MTNFIESLFAKLDLRRDPPGAAGEVVILRDGEGRERLEDIERFQPAPRRLRRVVNHSDFASFLLYLDERKEKDTRVYIGAHEIVAVLDHPSRENEPTWECHKSLFPLNSPFAFGMWEKAVSNTGTSNDQATFALLLERRARDILQPDAATMLEIALTLEAKPNVNWKSAINITNGDRQFMYEETTAATAGAKGQLVIPSEFQIGLPMFEGAPPVNIDIRLRYQLKAGVILFILEWVDLDQARKDTVEKMKEIIESTHGVPCYVGNCQDKY